MKTIKRGMLDYRDQAQTKQFRKGDEMNRIKKRALALVVGVGLAVSSLIVLAPQAQAAALNYCTFGLTCNGSVDTALNQVTVQVLTCKHTAGDVPKPVTWASASQIGSGATPGPIQSVTGMNSPSTRSGTIAATYMECRGT
jgi:hypothetical protein